jgi:hypothetical protein
MPSSPGVLAGSPDDASATGVPGRAFRDGKDGMSVLRFTRFGTINAETRNMKPNQKLGRLTTHGFMREELLAGAAAHEQLLAPGSCHQTGVDAALRKPLRAPPCTACHTSIVSRRSSSRHCGANILSLQDVD